MRQKVTATKFKPYELLVIVRKENQLNEGTWEMAFHNDVFSKPTKQRFLCVLVGKTESYCFGVTAGVTLFYNKKKAGIVCISFICW